ncbi:MAG: 4Fe-4S dicluster domain-containing protein, partial [Candidatus Nitrosocaldaceae archaeon]
DKALFRYALSPYSWKRYLFPPSIKLFEITKKDGIKIIENDYDGKKLAFIGVRACEIHAIYIQDKVFLDGKFIDPVYKKRRDNIFIFAVNCITASNTCFCVSMNTGPKVTFGYDLALTEVIEPNHYFIIDVGSKLGEEILKNVRHREANNDEIKKAEEVVNNTAKSMKRSIDTSDIKELLYSNYESEYWNDVAKRCLSCTNCTMVCPTCFCNNVEDVTDLKGESSERWRVWDSCFTNEFTYIHGNTIRSSTAAKYRHWITHKLATWIDQFGSSGCVGCGRCITWCPVGIDITEEIRALRSKR